MKFGEVKYRKSLTNEEWFNCTNLSFYADFLQNKLEVAVEKTEHEQLHTDNINQALEEYVNDIFYIASKPHNANLRFTLTFYFRNRDDMLKCKMCLPSILNNYA